jgi:RNA-directed DNA polymerase
LANHPAQRSPTPSAYSAGDKGRKEGRWGKVQALQRLLTHSYSGKVLAVRRVTENNGKKTPGVDQEIWDTPEKKTQAVHELKCRGYQPQPLRRVYIPKSDSKTMRPLGIPTMKALRPFWMVVKAKIPRHRCHSQRRYILC